VDMNISTTDSTVRLISGLVLLIFTLFIFTPPTFWHVSIFWVVSVYLLVTGIFFCCPIYKILGVKKK